MQIRNDRSYWRLRSRRLGFINKSRFAIFQQGFIFLCLFREILSDRHSSRTDWDHEQNHTGKWDEKMWRKMRYTERESRKMQIRNDRSYWRFRSRRLGFVNCYLFVAKSRFAIFQQGFIFVVCFARFYQTDIVLGPIETMSKTTRVNETRKCDEKCGTQKENHEKCKSEMIDPIDDYGLADWVL